MMDALLSACCILSDKYWTVEMAIPFKQLFAGLGRDNDLPEDREIWRANFVR